MGRTKVLEINQFCKKYIFKNNNSFSSFVGSQHKEFGLSTQQGTITTFGRPVEFPLQIYYFDRFNLSGFLKSFKSSRKFDFCSIRSTETNTLVSEKLMRGFLFFFFFGARRAIHSYTCKALSFS